MPNNRPIGIRNRIPTSNAAGAIIAMLVYRPGLACPIAMAQSTRLQSLTAHDRVALSSVAK